MKKLIYIFVVAIAFGFIACENNNGVSSFENENTLPIVNNIDGILSFDNVDDFNTVLKEVANMTSIERENWEKLHNFHSFGTLADRIYNNIIPEKFQNMEEIIAFVEENNKYVELVTDETGELSCVPREENNIERYLILLSDFKNRV